MIFGTVSFLASASVMSGELRAAGFAAAAGLAAALEIAAAGFAAAFVVGAFAAGFAGAVVVAEEWRVRRVVGIVNRRAAGTTGIHSTALARRCEASAADARP